MGNRAANNTAQKHTAPCRSAASQSAFGPHTNISCFCFITYLRYATDSSDAFMMP